MEDREIMKFKSENGSVVELEAVARIYLEEREYLILAPLEGDQEDAYVFRVDNVQGNLEYNLVEDDEEFLAVKKEYKELVYENE